MTRSGAGEFAEIQGAADFGEDVVEIDGLEEVIDGPGAHGGDGGFDGAVGGEHDDGRFGGELLDVGEEGEAVHLGHADVGEDDVGGLLEEEVGGGFAVGGFEHVKAFAAEEFGERFAKDLFVFGNRG